MDASREQLVCDAYTRWGFSFTPLSGKRPTLKAWASAPRECLAQARAWAAAGNVGVRCGQSSADAAGRGLLAVDLDTGFDLSALKGLGLPHTLTARTGSGGWHLYYRLPAGVVLGNSASKLLPHVDTRGDGGQIVFPGSIHPQSNQPYAWAPTRGPAEFPEGPVELPPGLVAMLQAGKSSPAGRGQGEGSGNAPVDVHEPSPPPLPRGEGQPPPAAGDSLKPGDDYNARGDYRAMLIRAGWVKVRDGENEHWRRPGKTEGMSATLKGGCFYVFTGNAPPFEAEKGYDGFAIYSLLEHGGNYSQAAKALSAAGYGKRAPSPRGRGQGEGSPTGPVPSGEPSPNPLPAGEGGQPPGYERVALGEIEPQSGRLVLSPDKTPPTAIAYVRQFHLVDDPESPSADDALGLGIEPPHKLRTLHAPEGQLLEWRDNHYCEVNPGTIRNRLYAWLHQALRYNPHPGKDKPVYVDFSSNPRTVGAALDNIVAHVDLPGELELPCWLRPADGRPDPREVLTCRTCNYHLPSGQRMMATPDLLTTNALDYDYDANAARPALWLEKLSEVWPDDPDSIALLQEYIGYLLTPDTSLQKMLLIVGPKRSFKGTIARIVSALIGRGNVAGPTTDSLAGQFGMEQLVGKSLAIVSDARFGGPNLSVIVERLLCISGEDTVTTRLPYGKRSISVKLPTRFLFLSNEVPRLSDTAGALAGRMLVLQQTKSFFGLEDVTLTDRLLVELPGILNWAIEGWRRLHSNRGRFTSPESAQPAADLLLDLASPFSEFLRDCCEIAGPTDEGWDTPAVDLFAAYVAWCEAQGYERKPTRASMGKQLATIAPQCRVHRVGPGGMGGRSYERLRIRQATSALPIDDGASHDAAATARRIFDEPPPTPPAVPHR